MQACQTIAAYCLAMNDIGRSWVKQAAVVEKSFGLTGVLYLSKSGWLLLSVPNQFVRGAFDALHERGVELPLNEDGRLNSHISVMAPDEIEEIGGPEAITERGHQFRYSLGPLRMVEPSNWKGVSRVWYITVDSPELRDLRRSYGLPPLRKGFDHHITVAVRKVYATKASSILSALSAATTPIQEAIPNPIPATNFNAGIHRPIDVNQQPPEKNQLQIDLADPATAAGARSNFAQRLRALINRQGQWNGTTTSS